MTDGRVQAADEEWPERIRRARIGAAEAGIDALLLSPGPDLRYLTGYQALPLERLTCLVVRAGSDPVMVVPNLERPAAQASPAGAAGLEIVGWDETDDPYDLVARLVPDAAVVALDNQMWAEKVLRLRAALPGVGQQLAGEVMSPLRMRKSRAEIDALRQAGAAIDRVHARVPEWLRAGRTERQVGADIAEAIRTEGHTSVDFVIVGSGPNGASPHHELSDRMIRPGDPVVVDIGGTTSAGYCSDCTRTYVVGEPSVDFLTSYDVLHRAQTAAVHHVRPGVTCASVDAAARNMITDAGFGELFIHRTGHGIGLQTHEDPYIVQGNDLLLEPGMAFSVEPGIYHPGHHGARIEDIVVCVQDGVESLNRGNHDLVLVPA
ncbi:M24 family metallopeptidase [Tessaracoccus antarcticus]|uniref:Aminopeptidase P family protein n=1 Tax=Tessaracoccus antarcticus TaxID=2479848 RepID=A0A3M0GC69_9ACTN|nr:Xaa-Pro peptidase family protein [Tessaracoccus antarcticus]RMB60222.1 aminopeptidase P family protein [Tessaracoccus antarcticus]